MVGSLKKKQSGNRKNPNKELNVVCNQRCTEPLFSPRKSFMSQQTCLRTIFHNKTGELRELQSIDQGTGQKHGVTFYFLRNHVLVGWESYQQGILHGSSAILSNPGRLKSATKDVLQRWPFEYGWYEQGRLIQPFVLRPDNLLAHRAVAQCIHDSKPRFH